MSRPLFRVACAAVSLAAAAVACAGSDETSPPPSSSDQGEGGIVLLDASATDAADAPNDVAAPDDAGDASSCSADGWCIAPLPDSSLDLVDVWPLADRSFALAKSASLGVKVLEWDGASGTWSYIDDATQNGFPGAATNLWAPNQDEVYFAISDLGTFGAYVYHGTRSAAPSKTWTWTRLRFDCDRNDATPHVWGTSGDDVYVLSCSAIHHLDPDGAGDASSVAEWDDDDDTDHPLELLGAAGTAADDLWFVGTRGWDPGQCAVVVRKTAAGYQRIIDGIPSANDRDCDPKAGYPTLAGAFRAGVVSLVRGRLIGLRYSDSPGNALVRITENDGGTYAFASSKPPAAMAVNLRSFWGETEDDLWLISTRGGGGGVLRSTSTWADAAVYQYSTLALGSAPNFQSLERIRGTSKTNLWAVGDDRAFHKTTP